MNQIQKPARERAMKVRAAKLRVWMPAVLSAAIATGALSPVLLLDAEASKPSVSVRASPNVGFAPMRVVITAEIKGGPDDYEEFYCPTIEWDIVSLDGRGDGAKSEQKLECDPYQAGTSEIKRRYIREQVFKFSGEYNIKFNLKQKSKVVGGGRTSIKIRSGLGDGGN
jgi:hypothetical protein